MSRRKRHRKALASAALAVGADGGREPGRFSARRKTEVILRVLRGEPLDTLARELGVTAATLAQWRERVLGGGPAGLQSAPAAGRAEEAPRRAAAGGRAAHSKELQVPPGHRVGGETPRLPRA